MTVTGWGVTVCPVDDNKKRVTNGSLGFQQADDDEISSEVGRVVEEGTG